MRHLLRIAHGPRRALRAFALVAAAFAPLATTFAPPPAVAAPPCEPIDYLAVALPETDEPVRAALALAYPNIVFRNDGDALSFDGKTWLELGTAEDRPPAQVLANPSIVEQFAYTYPIAFDLEPRRRAFADPGRPRNDAFFRALYFGDAEAASNSTTVVREPRLANARFTVTTKRNVDCQLRAALSEIANEPSHVRFFENPAVGFNWLTIIGTDRLSSHSFGAALDINAELGQYWKWTGATEGRVGAYKNLVPEALVRAMERWGFIWGGKWNHFDGMHFEYRPELILHGRMVSG